MSQVLITQYLSELDLLKKIGGTHRESTVREAFKDLLKGWGKLHELTFIPEYRLDSATKDIRTVDGALLYELRVPFGYWEAKDSKDDLDAEIAFKFRRGYPQDNIIFEDSTQAVLIQNSKEVMRCSVADVKSLEKLLKLFFGYEREEIADFRKAVEQFKSDLPAVLSALRQMIERQYKENAAFRQAATRFLAHAQEAINPSLTEEDVREMLIQHILTEEIFSKVFDDSDFHRKNNVAQELYRLEETFFVGSLKRNTLRGLDPYYAAIRSAAAQISNHHEKETFLKVIYENFYKVYNSKAAERLGVVYTPNEVVRFMIEAADWLCERNFERNLIDKGVEILDPATGTGTFICELLEHFRGQPVKLSHKYREELHANEVAILPYYVANLNIESTYAAITGKYEEFHNLCFVDTLDNVGLHTARKGTTADLFGGVSEENVARIRRQNSRKISVVIGNPPYFANQANENDNNKSRSYPHIDGRISQTYIEASTAQKTKTYDMYVRFFRWASDRLADDGIIAFVSNNSFVHKSSFDGFRKIVAQEFNEVWVVDLKGDARTTGDRRRKQGGNIFDDQIRVGVAVWFCVRKRGAHGCRIFYESVRDYAKSDEKQEFIVAKRLRERQFETLRPDSKGHWLTAADSDFNNLLPIATKVAKNSKLKSDKVIFKSYSLGISTNRDEWLYDIDRENLERKVKALLRGYEGHNPKNEIFSDKIKWSETLKRRALRGDREPFDASCIQRASYRPFYSPYLYLSPLFIDRPGASQETFPIGSRNVAICFSDVGSRSDFVVLAVDGVADLHFGSSIDAYQQVPLYRYDEEGNRADNITDWALTQFRRHYQPGPGRRAKPITKEAIFQYTYAILHDPNYREEYAEDLAREFPRIPLRGTSPSTFWQISEIGERLLQLHLGYRDVEPFAARRVDIEDRKARAAGLPPKAILRSSAAGSRISIDTETTLEDIPSIAWEYRLGTRTGIDWVLEQYKESKPRDKNLVEEFDTYRFPDHKEEVIDLLLRVVAVSVETMKLVEALRDIV